MDKNAVIKSLKDYRNRLAVARDALKAAATVASQIDSAGYEVGTFAFTTQLDVNDEIAKVQRELEKTQIELLREEFD